jgi:hypothetical protein
MDEQGGSARKRMADEFKRADYNKWLSSWVVRANVESVRINKTKPPNIGACVMQAGLSMVVWILKREVRAIGGCLGIHRRW